MSDTVDTEAVIDLGQLALDFGKVDRVTYHGDGKTLESDTDHTVMLGLIACAFASRYLPGLNLGWVAQLALVHDLVEVYAGDTSTLRIDDDGRMAKKVRESEAQRRIETEFDNRLPWVPIMIETYERRTMAEARYVKALDKLLPKITHILNNGKTFSEQGVDRDELVRRYDDQLTELMGYAGDFQPLFELRGELIDMILTNVLPPPPHVHEATRSGLCVCGQVMISPEQWPHMWAPDDPRHVHHTDAGGNCDGALCDYNSDVDHFEHYHDRF